LVEKGAVGIGWNVRVMLERFGWKFLAIFYKNTTF
jgi:hypothetical protein